jgi:hypothetical protein
MGEVGNCFLCEKPLPLGRVFVAASIKHRHGEILSRRYAKNFHRRCFGEFERTRQKPNSATRFVIGYHQLEIQLPGVAAA